MTSFPRASGILLHPTSLPGRYGIGDMGEWAFRFVDWLAAHDQTIWQVLPLNPTGYGDSPYQALSAFAGSPLLISLDKLVEAGWLESADLADVPDFPADRVDYGWVSVYHDEKLTLAHSRFKEKATAEQKDEFEAWCIQNASWLEDYTLFSALKAKFEKQPWVDWPEPYALRDESTLKTFAQENANALDYRRFRQWMFFTQWQAVKDYAAEKGIRLFGDLPIFVAHDSADVWADRDAYYLDERGNPTVVAGVPPDYFSATGQRWGNPLYRWDKLKERGYRWWISRFETVLQLVDYLRIDHFRGFEAYWEIPGDEETAVNGKWVPGPGADFLSALRDALGDLPIIAEDLGVITPGVEKLRDDFELPGMKVLQFAWSDPKNPFLPHNHVENAVVYSGTHDNNTTVGWWLDEVDHGTRSFMQTYLEREIDEINWRFIQIGMASVGHTFIMTLQDVLGLGSKHRMNTPGKPGGNWQWRFTSQMLEEAHGDRLKHLTWLYQRRSDQQEQAVGDAAVRETETS